MRSTSTLAFLFSPALLIACLGLDCVTGTGKAIRKPITVEAFHGLVLEGAIDVQVTQGASQQVEVEAQPNLADLLVMDVKNGVCTIRTSKCWTSKVPFVVHLTTPMLDRVHVMGSGDVKGSSAFKAEKVEVKVMGSGDVALGFEAQQMDVRIQGSGNVKLTGSTRSLDCGVQGSGDVKAKGLRATQVKASIQGSGDVEVNAVESLEANVNGSGDVRYVARPATLTENISGSGSVGPLSN
ncbi:MAG: DUF2807 domain-containing protein [Flavobacteriales bacterium]|nr:DUF2807 domain-containing protein [Flavobacteriales bacterium]